MIVPNYVQEQIVDKEGFPTQNFSSFFINLLQGMQISISDEGYLVPSVSSDPNSVTPIPTTGGQLAQLQASFQTGTVNPNTQTVTPGVQIGTIVFDPYEVNGGSGGTPRLGQLKVLLNDGTFHKITNT